MKTNQTPLTSEEALRRFLLSCEMAKRGGKDFVSFLLGLFFILLSVLPRILFLISLVSAVLATACEAILALSREQYERRGVYFDPFAHHMEGHP